MKDSIILNPAAAPAPDALDIGVYEGRVALRIGWRDAAGVTQSREFFLTADVAGVLAEQIVFAARLAAGMGVAAETKGGGA